MNFEATDKELQLTTVELEAKLATQEQVLNTMESKRLRKARHSRDALAPDRYETIWLLEVVMTAQIPDSFQYRDQDYSLAGVNGGKLFEPEKHGLQPVESCTACYHGFVCSYALIENHLVLEHLSITLSDPAPDLFGTRPSEPESEHSIWDAYYIDLKHPVKFTGGLLIAKGFIRDLYVHMGFHPAWKYEEVHELVFEDGTLKDAFDRSEFMADLRKRRQEAKDAAPDERREPTKAEIGDWIDRCFSLEYRGLF